MNWLRKHWNPLSCGGSSLPLPVLLLAKLLVAALLLTGHIRWIVAPGVWQPLLQTGIVLGSLALFLNLRVRVSAGAVGLMLAIGASLPSAVAWEILAVGSALLLMIAIWQPWPLRILVLMIFAAAAADRLPLHAPYQLPVYLGLAAGLMVPSLRPYAIWVSCLWHSGLLFFDVPAVPGLYFVLLTGPLAFVDWPLEAIVIYDGDCGICNASKRLWQRFDFDRVAEWHPLQSGIGARWSISREAVEKRVHLVVDGKVEAGFRVVKRLFLLNPVTWLVMSVILAAPPEEWLLYRQIVIASLVAFFARPFEFLGEGVYLWIARNRYWLSSGGACATDSKQ